MSKFNSCLRNGHVSFGDDFDSVAEVTHLFGLKAAKLPYHTCFNIPEKERTIAWLVAEDGGTDKTGGQWHNIREFGPTQESHGWNEILRIAEFNDTAETTSRRIEEELAEPRTRYVFWRENRMGACWYKFYGVFEIDAEATRATLSTVRPSVIYRCTAKTAECIKVEEVRTMFADADFAALKGKVVSVDFLDEIEFTKKYGNEDTGNVKVWPGTKLLVDEVTEDIIAVKCKATDVKLLEDIGLHISGSSVAESKESVVFVIPRRDFELGYVRVL